MDTPTASPYEIASHCRDSPLACPIWVGSYYSAGTCTPESSQIFCGWWQNSCMRICTMKSLAWHRFVFSTALLATTLATVAPRPAQAQAVAFKPDRAPQAPEFVVRGLNGRERALVVVSRASGIIGFVGDVVSSVSARHAAAERIASSLQCAWVGDVGGQR